MKIVSGMNSFYRRILLRRLRFVGLSVLEVSVLTAVLSGGVSALYLTRHNNNQTEMTPTTQTSNNTVPAQTTVTPATSSNQDTKPNNTATQNTPAKTQQTTSAPMPDEYGCIPQTAGYDNCVVMAKKNALSIWCSDQDKKASDTYIAQSAGAKPAYDAVMAEWNAVKDQPYYTHSPYDEYAADAKTKFNAIEKPAYATYVSTINSLNAQGCNLIKTYSDISWPGY
ncbi:MAG TPA: hypothetical protein VHB51_02530 [Candidatus Saccharimonadales bacterium]|nr:hypothetical protein [Candidatus Saccharimonadales bacterium]